MRHNVTGRKFNRTKSHKDAMLANMTASLLEHKKLHTTEAKAKELRPFAEAIITKAKHALSREKQNLLPAGQTVDIHNRRLVYRTIRNKGVIQELFDAIAPVVEPRNGGYCRITKTGTRRGDAARTAIIELVDWSAPIDGITSNKRKKKTTKKVTPQSTTTAKVKDTKTTPVEEKIEAAAEIKEEIVSVSEETTSVVEAKETDTPTEDTPVAEATPEADVKTDETPTEEVNNDTETSENKE